MAENKKVNAEAEEILEEIKEETVAEDVNTDEAEETKSSDCDCKDDAREEKTCRGEKKKLKKAEAEIADLKKKLSDKEAELAELNDKYMRLFAEYDNFRKRTAKEREGLVADASCDTLAQILPVLDNLERAAQYNTEDSAETPMGKGLELTLKSFAETLSKLGVCEIEALGKSFDPNIHNAVMHVDDDTLGENEVVEVFMKGYAKGDKVLRHSMVKVAN